MRKKQIIKWTILSICGCHFIFQDGYHEDKIIIGISSIRSNDLYFDVIIYILSIKSTL